MSIDARYQEQVRLLVELLPFLNDEPCFALKGGTAINLFVQPFPQLQCKNSGEIVVNIWERLIWDKANHGDAYHFAALLPFRSRI